MSEPTVVLGRIPTPAQRRLLTVVCFVCPLNRGGCSVTRGGGGGGGEGVTMTPPEPITHTKSARSRRGAYRVVFKHGGPLLVGMSCLISQ